MIIRRATREDLPRILSFLDQAKVGTNGVEKTIDCFLMIEDEMGNLQATIGIEPLGQVGLKAPRRHHDGQAYGQRRHRGGRHRCRH